MKLCVEELSPVSCRVVVKLSPAKVDALLSAAVQAQVLERAVDGYRVGTAPPELVEKRFVEQVQSIAQQNLLDTVMDCLIHEHRCYPVNRAAYDDCTLQRGQGCSFSLHAELIPRLSLPQHLEELTVRVGAPVVDSQVFFAAMQKLRQARGVLCSVDEARCPQEGDVAFVDVQAACDGQAVPGLSVQNLALRFSSSEAHPELCLAVRALTVGEQAHCCMPCPRHYPDATLHDREVQLTVYLRDLKKETLPELNDAFAAALGQKDVRRLQDEVYKDLLNKVIVRHQRVAEEELLDGVVNAQDFVLPPSLLTIYRKAHAVQARAYFACQGLEGKELEQKLEQLTHEGEATARRQAKAQAVLMALAYREKLTVSAQELEQEVQKMAHQTGRTVEALRTDLYRSKAVYELQDQLLADKALRHLYTKARKIVVDKDGKMVTEQSFARV